ncbi:MAG: Snf7 family protein, partial [Promethearchaeota archaeon]
MPFGKKKKIDKDQVYAEIKKSIKKLDTEVKKKEAQAREFKDRAKQALIEKNEALARQYLQRKKNMERQIEKILKIQSNLANQADAIEEAETLGIASEAIKMATEILNRYADYLKKMDIDGLIEKAEESRYIIEDVGEALADNGMTDYEMEDAINSGIEELQSEIALEMAGGLAEVPETPSTEIGIEDSLSTTGPEKSADEVQDELKRLKKE